MKSLSLLSFAALGLGLCLPASAYTTPTYTTLSYGFYNTTGPIAIEYWVDAYDSTGGLTALNTAGWDEVYNSWHYYGSTGDGYHRSSNGWGYTYDGYSNGQISITDWGVNYYYTPTWSF